MADNDLVNVKIDGIAVQVPKGTPAIEAAKKAGVDIPFFCYHPKLSMEAGANCRMCLVEVATPRKGPDGTISMAKMPKPQTACSLPVSEGMEIETQTEQVIADRKAILEFLLINHPLDCPICDRGGECPLQNNTIFYGPQNSRFIEEKRHFPKAYPLSKHVVFDRERCIHCARCTRFTDDISGDHQLAFLKRGADMYIDTFNQSKMVSKFSGNVIEICPVGALLSRDYRFKARPWDILSQKSICTQCSNGCNIKLDYRVGRLQRVNARLNEAVNEEWTCDKGKFGMDYVSTDQRLVTPLIRRDGALQPATWSEAMDLVVQRLKEAGKSVGAIGGARCTNEDNYILQKFFRNVLKSNNLDHRLGTYLPPAQSGLHARLGYHTMGNAIADFERMKTIFVIGSDLVNEQPILFLRVRKAWRFKGGRIIAANPAATQISEFADPEVTYRAGAEVALLNGIIKILAERNPSAADLPGYGDFIKSLAGWSIEKAAEESGVSAERIRRIADAIFSGETAFIAGKAVTEHPDASAVIEAICNLAVLSGNAANVNIPVTQCNAQGAMDMGLLPDSAPGYTPVEEPGLNTRQMLEAAADSNLKALWLVGADPVAHYTDADLAKRALGGDTFVIASELFLTPSAELADVVLPVASVAEKDGTYTNCERRVQRIFKAFELSPDVHPDWFVFADASGRLEQPLPYFSARDILREINVTVPLYADCSPQKLGNEGIRWQYPSAKSDLQLVPVEYRPLAKVTVAE